VIYIDTLFPCVPKPTWPYKEACHMISDGGIEELDQFAIQLGLKVAWRQYDHDGFAHYDLTSQKRNLAIHKGAVYLEPDRFIDKLSELRLAQWLDGHTEEIGRKVREKWVECCLTQEDAPPHHLTSYDDISPWDQWVDNEIGKAVAQYTIIAYARRNRKG
jgi:hypothetical protein